MPNEVHDIAKRLDKLGSKGIVAEIDKIAERYAIRTQDLTKRLMRQRLTPRSGRLIGSLRYSVVRSGNTVTATVSSGGPTTRGPVAYAGVHEYGATITPKRGKYLRLPLSSALTGRGVDKFSGLSLRDNEDFAFVPRQGKDPLLIHRPSGVPWYVLKTSVTIPPRPTLGPAARFAQRQLIDELSTIVNIKGKP